MLSSTIRIWALVSIAAFSPCSGREILHLANGFSLEANSHTQIEDRFVLSTATGTLELPIREVLQVEVVPETGSGKETPVVQPSATRVSPPEDIPELVRLAAASQGTAPEFIRFVQSVARVESGFQKNAVSIKGALGLMQLMPGTAKGLGVTATDPVQNVQGGAKYLRELLQLYRNDSVLALAAYNAGPGAVQKYGGVPPYSETWQYVRKVLREYAKLSKPDPLNQSAKLAKNPTATK